MCASRKIALIASANPAEDTAAAVCAAGFEPLFAKDGYSALQTVRALRPDALLADWFLPGLDGIALARAVGRESLTVYPAPAVLLPAGINTRIDIGCAALCKPLTADAVERFWQDYAPEHRSIDPGIQAHARRLLQRVGIPEHCGRDYLLRAIEIAWLDARFLSRLHADLYPAVAEAFHADARRVERMIRHVIDAAWSSGAIQAQYDLFGDTIDAKRGSPTCGEMIARIADILRWEGRA